MAAANQPQTLLEAIRFFSDYENCREAVESIRWTDGTVVCPHCGSERVAYLAKQRRYKCYEKHARAQFSLKVGTIFEDSAVGLEKWLPALWLLTNCKNGISSYELGRALGVTQKTAWFMLSRLRLALQSEDGGKLGGEVEVDETYIGGKARNMHASRRAGIMKRGGFKGKVAVMGLLERGKDQQSRVRTVVVPSNKRSDLLPHVDAAHATSRLARPSTPTHCTLTACSRPTTSTRWWTTPWPTLTGRFTPTASNRTGRCSSAPSAAPTSAWNRSISFVTSMSRRSASTSAS